MKQLPKFSTLFAIGLLASCCTANAVLIANFDGINPFSAAGGVTATVTNVDGDPDNEYRVTAASGFTTAFSTFIPRSGSLFDAFRNNDLLEFKYQSLDADNAGTFINIQFVIQTDAWFAVGVVGNDFNVLDGIAQFVAPNSNVAETQYSKNIKNIGADPVNAVLDAYAGGAGSFMNFWVIQQSDAASTISYDDFNMVAVPEPSTYAALAGAALLGLVYLRRRK